jgi:uncharacterized SAM-binding protein YcdF (DUF218 family)
VIAGAAVVRYLFTSGGIVTVFALLVAWTLTRPRSRPARAVLIAVTIMYLAASLHSLPLLAAAWLGRSYQPLTQERAPDAAQTAIVLLGSGSYTQRSWSGNQYSILDPTGAERVAETARLYHLLKPRWVVSSGGRVMLDDPDLPSAQVMRDELIQLGVPADRILLEDSSRTTRDEATAVKALLPALKVQHLVLVTSAVHMRRSVGVFRSVGLPVVPAIARDAAHGADSGWLTWLPSTAGLDESQAVMHELLGLAYYSLRGWQ